MHYSSLYIKLSQLVELLEDISLSQPCIRLKVASTTDTSRKVHTLCTCTYAACTERSSNVYLYSHNKVVVKNWASKCLVLYTCTMYIKYMYSLYVIFVWLSYWIPFASLLLVASVLYTCDSMHWLYT